MSGQIDVSTLTDRWQKGVFGISSELALFGCRLSDATDRKHKHLSCL